MEPGTAVRWPQSSHRSSPLWVRWSLRSNGKEWYSWEDVELMGRFLGLPTVPVLGTGYVTSVDDLKMIIDEYMKQPSTYGNTKEGVVIRVEDAFSMEEPFYYNVCKYVRANHVQTNEHWTKHWKKAQLIDQ